MKDIDLLTMIDVQRLNYLYSRLGIALMHPYHVPIIAIVGIRLDRCRIGLDADGAIGHNVPFGYIHMYTSIEWQADTEEVNDGQQIVWVRWQNLENGWENSLNVRWAIAPLSTYIFYSIEIYWWFSARNFRSAFCIGTKFDAAYSNHSNPSGFVFSILHTLCTTRTARVIFWKHQPSFLYKSCKNLLNIHFKYYFIYFFFGWNKQGASSASIIFEFGK